MSFPSTPVVGQTYTSLNGTAWIYTSNNEWVLYNSAIASTTMTGASAATSGTSGAVPAPLAGQNNLFLRGDGTWSSPSGISPFNPALAYTAGSAAQYYDTIALANGAIPAATTFAWGTSGATWTPFITQPSQTWKGVWSSGTAYPLGSVVVETTASQTVYFCAAAVASGGTTPSSNPAWTELAFANEGTVLGATAATAGREGLVPGPASGYQDAPLFGDGTFDRAGRLSFTVLSNIPASGPLTKTTSVDIASVVEISQTTASIALTLPTPTVTTKEKSLIVVNTGTVSFTMNGVTLSVPAAAEFIWSVTNQAWVNASFGAMSGATATVSGIGGTVPLPLAGYQDARLMGDATYDQTDRLTSVTMTNFAASGSIGAAAATVDVAGAILIPQTTSGVTLSLPSPTVTAKTRKVTVVNTGTATFAIGNQFLKSGSGEILIWNGASWTSTSGAPAYTASATAPTNAIVGDYWYDTTQDYLYLRTFDGNSNFWLNISGNAQVGTAANAVPVGSIQAYGGTTAPLGWLMCDGTTYARAVYVSLFNIIGINFGYGDGVSTFNVPDLRGNFLRGVDGTAGRDPDNASRVALYAGGNTGNTVGSYEADQYYSHSHSASLAGRAIGAGGGTYAFVDAGTAGSWFGGTSIQIYASGGNETRPKNVNVNYIIKY